MSLIVLTKATSKRLTTLARAQALLGFGPGEAAAVGMMLDQASSNIEQFCRRAFGVETLRELVVYIRSHRRS